MITLDYFDGDVIIISIDLVTTIRPLNHDLGELFRNHSQCHFRAWLNCVFMQLGVVVYNILRPRICKMITMNVFWRGQLTHIHNVMPVKSNDLAQKWNNLAQLPILLGVLIKLHLYINHKYYHSVNVHGVFDASLNFHNVVSKRLKAILSNLFTALILIKFSLEISIKKDFNSWNNTYKHITIRVFFSIQ